MNSFMIDTSTRSAPTKSKPETRLRSSYSYKTNISRRVWQNSSNAPATSCRSGLASRNHLIDQSSLSGFARLAERVSELAGSSISYWLVTCACSHQPTNQPSNGSPPVCLQRYLSLIFCTLLQRASYCGRCGRIRSIIFVCSISPAIA